MNPRSKFTLAIGIGIVALLAMLYQQNLLPGRADETSDTSREAKISGLVKDTDGKLVQGATVSCLVREADKWNQKVQTNTDGNGRYQCNFPTTQTTVYVTAQNKDGDWCDIEVDLLAKTIKYDDIILEKDTEGESTIEANLGTPKDGQEIIARRKYPFNIAYSASMKVTDGTKSYSKPNLRAGYYEVSLQEGTKVLKTKTALINGESTDKVTFDTCDKDAIKTGANVSLQGCRFLPDDDPFNTDISSVPKDPNSDGMINTIRNLPLTAAFEMSYNIINRNTPTRLVSAPTEAAPYNGLFRNPTNPKPVLESGDDHHRIVLDKDSNELFETYTNEGQTAYFKLDSSEWTERVKRFAKAPPRGVTSANVAGMPIFPGLLRYDEACEQQEINHALIFAVPDKEGSRQGYIRNARVFPANFGTFNSVANENFLPMGVRLRFKGEIPSNANPCTKAVLKALKKYGMFLTDATGHVHKMKISGATNNPRGGEGWSGGASNQVREDLERFTGKDFEVVQMRNVITFPTR